MVVTPRAHLRARSWLRRGLMAALALITVVASTTVVVSSAPGRASADTVDNWLVFGRLDDGRAPGRLDLCRLGFVLQAGGPAVKAVARDGLAGTPDQMHAAANPQYWNSTPLGVAYNSDESAISTMWNTLGQRHYTWDQSIPGYFSLPSDSNSAFHWSPDFFSTLGIEGFWTDQYFAGESSLYVDLAPKALPATAAAALQVAKDDHLYYGYQNNVWTNPPQADFSAWGALGTQDLWGNGSPTTGNLHADDIREFLQYGGFPHAAPAPGSVEYRMEVEALKLRYASCDTDNPLDPDHMLASVVRTAGAEWQAELDSQATQRAAIVAAEVKGYSDLQTAANAMVESVGQAWIAGQLTKWQSYWSPGGPGTAGSGPITVKLKSATTMCLDNASGLSTNGNKIQAYTCNSTASQQWRPGNAGLQSYLDGPLVNTGTNKCLDLSGTNVVLYTCTSGKANQHWQYTTTGGQTRLFNVGAQKCLNFASTVKGTQATVQACTGGTPQQFLTSQNNVGTGTGTDNPSFPKPADFTYATTEIGNARTRATAQLTIANNASADAQTQASAVTAAEAAAGQIATANHTPYGRGLAYAQQSAQVTKASASAAQAAVLATQTAVNATKAAAADSATLVALAQTQSAAMQAQYARAAAQEAAAQAHAAATAAAQDATAAATAAATAHADRLIADQAKATATAAAAKAAAQRAIAEQQKAAAASARQEAEHQHAIAAAADADAEQKQVAAAAAASDAQAAENDAANHDAAALAAEAHAKAMRSIAAHAADTQATVEARAAALQAAADQAEGTDQAEAARAAANAAQAAADQAAAAAAQAAADADTAEQAAIAARAAATAAHAAAARAHAAADAADAAAATARKAASTAHAAAADALAASKVAAGYADDAQAQAASAEADMQQAATDSLAAQAAAVATQADAVKTAGEAYATSLASVAARDSALAVAAPANAAVGLGSPFQSTDSGAALAVLVGQGALTVAAQEQAAAQARADDAANAASVAAALADQATADAKVAAQAAAAAAADAAAAAHSAVLARNSAAAAAADAAAAASDDAATAALAAQAQSDAAAAHDAADAADGEAAAADAAADAAERDAAAARAAATQAAADAAAAQAAADQAARDADQAEAAAATAQADATDAEQSAAQAEAQARTDEVQSRVVATWDGGFAAEEMQPDLTIDQGGGSCTANPTCDIDIDVHVYGTAYYNLVVCEYVGSSGAVTCIRQPLTSVAIDTHVTRTLHVNVWDILIHSVENLKDALIGDFISCGKAIYAGTVNSDCAWAAVQLLPFAKLDKLVAVVVDFNAAIRAGVGIDKALDAVRAADISIETLPKLVEETDAATTLVDCVITGNSFGAGTPVLLADGTSKPIEDIQIGDLVRAGDPDTGATRAEPVTDTIRHSGLHTMVDITLAAGGVIHTTDHHLFWDASAETYVNAIDLRVGDDLTTPDERHVEVLAVSNKQADLTAYNLTVADLHTYYVEAGSIPVLVHNDGGTCPVAAMTAAGKASYQTLIDALSRVRAMTPAQLRGLLSAEQLEAGIQEPYLRRMFLGSVIENAVANDAAVRADAAVAHLGTAAPGQAVADFVISDGTTSVNIDITGSSGSSISSHLGRVYIVGRAQILDYASFDDATLNAIFQ